MTLRNRLAALFSATRRLADADGTLLRQGGTWGDLEWVVPRSRCQFRRVELPAMAPAQRLAAAELAAKRAYPQPDCCHYLQCSGSTAQVWIWRPEGPAADAAELRWLPESCLFPPARDDGARLLELTVGVEGQLWRDGEMLASRWWPGLPEESQWLGFVRAAGAPGLARPEPQRLALGEPARGDRAWWAFASPARLERATWLGAAALALFALGWQLAAALSWTIGMSWQSSRLDELRGRAAPLVAAREQAEADLATLNQYLSLQSGPSDYVLMTDVVGPLPADAVLTAWRREGQRLQASVRSAEADPRVFVASFQAHPRLSRAVANPLEGGQMQLDFEVVGRGTEPGSAEEAAP